MYLVPILNSGLCLAGEMPQARIIKPVERLEWSPVNIGGTVASDASQAYFSTGILRRFNRMCWRDAFGCAEIVRVQSRLNTTIDLSLHRHDFAFDKPGCSCHNFFANLKPLAGGSRWQATRKDVPHDRFGSYCIA
jgi:hypothetical protein